MSNLVECRTLGPGMAYGTDLSVRKMVIVVL